uniref:RRM domain-containing protein n=1 Tax=Neogobius melanostomus TaxID=47308 RepID=A0A8C6T7P1_9GOBI
MKHYVSCETKEDSLEEAFGQFGTVKKVNVVKDQHTGKSRGFGFIRYENVQCAEDALATMDGKILGGRPIRVERVKRGRGGTRKRGCGGRDRTLDYKSAFMSELMCCVVFQPFQSCSIKLLADRTLTSSTLT